MIKTKYIPQENAEKILSLMNKCLLENKDIVFVVYDTEELVYKGKSPEEVIKTMDGGDEEFGINCKLGKDYIGWFGILPYEEDPIFDCSDNDFCNSMLRED